LRILQVGKYYHPHIGGIETHLETLCAELSPLLDVSLLVAADRRVASREFLQGLPVHRAATMCHVAGAPICPSIIRDVARSDADIIHIHLPNPIGMLAGLAARPTARLVATYHSDIVRQRILGRAMEPLLLRMLKRCDAIVATSHNYMASSPVLRRYRDRCRLVPYGIHLQRLGSSSTEMERRIRSAYGTRIVLAVGRLVYYKGFEFLIRAISKIRGHLLLAGDGPLRQALEEEARAAGVAERVHFLGAIQNSELLSYYQASQVFALPSIARSEAFGIVQLEAMACGRPVVNTQLESGVPFVSIDGVTGFTVPPKDSDALAAALNRLLDDPALCARFGEAGRRRVEHEFTAERMARRTIEVYRSVLGTPSLATVGTSTISIDQTGSGC
jgi:glycosyltransferase involved in cell wall biosynthesis